MSNIHLPLETIQKFAPLVYLHPWDNHHPISVEDYLKKLKLVCSDGSVIPQPNFQDLVQCNEEGNYLDWLSDAVPNGTDDFPTGTPISGAVGQATTGLCQVPCYAKVFPETNHVDIVYAFLYEFNGCSPFRAGLYSLDSESRKINFPWSGFGRHKSDWEHVTVRLKLDLSDILEVFYSQHSSAQRISKQDISLYQGSHPIAYSGLNTHANYPEEGAHSRNSILPSPGIAPISWLKLADVTTTANLYVYEKPFPLFNEVKWRTWENVISLDGDSENAKWLNFKGRWGASLTADNKAIAYPPKLPMHAETFLHSWGCAFEWINVIPAKVFSGDAPRSPLQQRWWREKEANRD